VLATFFASAVESPGGPADAATRIGLFEGGTLINRFGSLFTPAASRNIVPFAGFIRFTPTAGSHSYTVAGWITVLNGVPGIDAGTGGPGALPPAFVRFTKV
jgi:hypothetical protein